MEKRRPTVVVTGFGPFGIHLKNASWEAVKLLKQIQIEDECDIRLVTEEVTVAYDEVEKVVPKLWKQHNPVLMVHVGVSHMAKYLTLESCANRSGYCRVDVKECKAPNGVNASGEVEHIKTKIEVDRIRNEAKEFSVNLEISNDARKYLCEYIYYTSLNINCSCTIFVHVPMINEDYSASKIAEHIKLIIKLALKQLEENK